MCTNRVDAPGTMVVVDPLTMIVEELQLRPFRVSDAPQVVEACRDPESMRWLPGLPYPYELHHAEYYCARNSVDGWSAGPMPLAVTDRASGLLLASVGPVQWRPEAHEAEIGYWVHPEGRGRDLCTRATAAVSRWLLTEAGVRRLELLADVQNLASQRVAEKAGFTREGLLRERISGWRRPDGTNDTDVRRDAYIFSLLPRDL